MAEAVTNQTIQRLGQRLAVHPIYTAVASIEDLRCFMQHHVYSVWDFMSLIKYLQAVVAPTQYPWLPGQDPSVQRFINELVLEEETDSHPLGDGHASHFELYLQGMQEVGADTGPVRRFVDQVQRNGIDTALDRADIPIPARDFTRTTFDFITTGRPHLAAAALALGREHVIPGMFRSILRESGVDERQAPIFHAYLKRHVHLDEDFHAPLSLRLLDGLCGGDGALRREATAAAEHALTARLKFWDGVLNAILVERARAPDDPG